MKTLFKNFFIIFIINTQVTSYAMEITSSFNPVGAGARGEGLSAFTAIADDATAGTWNPGGLIRQEELIEFSFGFRGLHRTESHTMGDNPSANIDHSVSDFNVNYIGLVSTFEAFGRNMSFALNYQHLYDFNRNWAFPYNEFQDRFIRKENWHYEQTGSLSAIGLSYCIELIKPSLSFGFTFNIWDNDISPNHWKQTYNMSGTRKLGNFHNNADYNKTENFYFDGINMNFGLMWSVNYKLSIGAILKTPFNADVKHTIEGDSVDNETRNEKLKMPLSYGIGMFYKYSDQLYFSADLYKTHWDNFIYIDKNGNQTSPISEDDYSTSDIDPTHQVRLGVEYLKLNPNNQSAIPFRLGLFYDPSPEEKNPDDFWGISIGTGLIKNNIGSIDIAYIYRFGKNAASSTLKDLDFSQDVYENMIYVSVISYFY